MTYAIVGVAIPVVWFAVAMLLTRWNAGLPKDERAPWLEPEHSLSWPFVVAAMIAVGALYAVLWPFIKLLDWAGRK